MTIIGNDNTNRPLNLEISEQQALTQLKEFFGAALNDELAKHALGVTRTSTGSYNLQAAINWILDQNSQASPSNARQFPVQPSSGASTSQTSSVYSTKVTQVQKNTTTYAAKVEESTRSRGDSRTIADVSEDELQKAIALSLSDSTPPALQQTPLGLGGQISVEEQELSKVIEASIFESKKGTGNHDLRQSSLFFVDPPDPHERERCRNWPVGLKNIGNTCWFSVVIQALFHMPIFRRCILNYDIECISTKCQASPSAPLPRELEFVMELRKLFAFLVASRRKYVDPSAAVDVLRKQDSLQLRNIGGLDSGQQDVSEFTHLLLEWLEEAFRLVLPKDEHPTAVKTALPTAQASLEEQKTENAIEKLFYGTVVIDDLSSGAASSSSSDSVGVTREERFSQYPLLVVGCESLHDSMERSVRSDESANTERWLEALPPVFLFELTRFQYNQLDRKPEKIHSKFRFPKVLYVDRYLRINKAMIREKRVYVGRLRQQLNALKHELEKLENFGSRSKLPLSDVLLYTLEYIGRVDDSRSFAGETEPMEGCEPAKMEPSSAATSSLCPAGFSRPSSDASPMELDSMARCLRRWREQVMKAVEELKMRIAEVEEMIEKVYCEATFQQHPYILHAVLVHEGQATSGHYWTFVRDMKSERWRKFNDVHVSEVSYEEVERDSIGGHQNTSAYCLVYVDVRRSDLFEDTSEMSDSQLIATLPMNLREFVTDDNAKFATELSDWDRRYAPVPSAPASSPTGGAPSSVTRSVVPTNVTKEAELKDLIDELKRLAAPMVKQSVHSRCNALKPQQITDRHAMKAFFNESIEETLNKTKRDGETLLANRTTADGLNNGWHACFDTRIQSWIVFGYCWLSSGGASNSAIDEAKLLQRLTLDYYANPILVGVEATDAMTEVYQQAHREISSMPELTSAEFAVYSRIYTNYKLYLQTVVLLSHALDRFSSGAYDSALETIVCTRQYNSKLAAESANAGHLDMHLILECERSAALHVSQQTLKEIVACTNDQEVLDKMKKRKQMLISSLSGLYNSGDSETLELVRAEWFSAISDDQIALTDTKLRVSRDLLDSLMEIDNALPPGSLVNWNVKITFSYDLKSRFNKALHLARELGFLKCQHAPVGECR